jgi:hypothetical protein
MNKYRVGIHRANGRYEEVDMEFSNRVYLGDKISKNQGDAEYTVVEIVHEDKGPTVIHCLARNGN